MLRILFNGPFLFILCIRRCSMTSKTGMVQRALQARRYLEGHTKSVRKYFLSDVLSNNAG